MRLTVTHTMRLAVTHIQRYLDRYDLLRQRFAHVWSGGAPQREADTLSQTLQVRQVS